MSAWTAQLVSAGGRTMTGDLISPSTLESLAPLLRDVPLCAHGAGASFGHPAPGAKGWDTLDRAAIVGRVLEVVRRPAVIFGRLVIEDPHLDRFLLRAERRGRLVESLGLSVHGRGMMLPAEYAVDGLWFVSVLSMDVVDTPLSGGHFIQSAAAEVAGAPWPELPTLAPRPTREHSSPPRIRYASTLEPIATEFRTIPPGGDY